MIISDNGETVEFKTISPFFEREKLGQKQNTVRVFKTTGEENLFISSLFSLNTIRIRNPDTKDSFDRLITDVCVAEMPIGMLSVRVYVISWQKVDWCAGDGE